jgi:hypothetical protein
VRPGGLAVRAHRSAWSSADALPAAAAHRQSRPLRPPARAAPLGAVRLLVVAHGVVHPVGPQQRAEADVAAAGQLGWGRGGAQGGAADEDGSLLLLAVRTAPQALDFACPSRKTRQPGVAHLLLRALAHLRLELHPHVVGLRATGCRVAGHAWPMPAPARAGARTQHRARLKQQRGATESGQAATKMIGLDPSPSPTACRSSL